MQITREDLNTCTVKLSVTCNAEQVKDAFDRALKGIAKEVRLPGFRPGHAPKHMVDKMVSPEELNNRAADQLVQRVYQKAVTEQGLQPDPGVRPSVEVTELDRNAGTAVFVAKVPLPAKIEIGEYKGVVAQRPAITVTDEEVGFQIDELRKRQGSREAIIDRGALEGDYCVVNLKGENETGEGRTFMVVVGQSFESLDGALQGMVAEEMKSVEMEFPENFADKAWANTKKKVQLTLSSISAVTLPPLDESFAKSLQTESVEALTERMRASILEAKEQMTREMLQEQILEKLRADSKIEVSDNMWEALASQRLNEIAQQQAEQGKSMEQYSAENGMTIDELVKAWHEQAKVHVERAMIVREVFAKEKLSISNEDLNGELFAMAQEYQVEPMELLEAMRKSGSIQEVQFRAISRKVTSYLIENAKIEETDAPAAEEKPKKKASSKKLKQKKLLPQKQ